MEFYRVNIHPTKQSNSFVLVGIIGLSLRDMGVILKKPHDTIKKEAYPMNKQGGIRHVR